ncbi:MAG TPA: discoidin domain-containing protein [Planctomycetota bacterium]|nr:discoidin domain-containing protein [Planctomycetota bacterium]
MMAKLASICAISLLCLACILCQDAHAFQVIHPLQYALTNLTLTVQSEPVQGIDIGGSNGGTTDYGLTVQLDDPVNLIAPAIINAPGNANYRFVRWTLDGTDHADGQGTLDFTVSGDHTAVAHYARVWTLTVKSTPITSVGITGDESGLTNYVAICEDQDSVTLTAPTAHIDGGLRYNFVNWTLDGVDAPAGPDLAVTMDADHTAVAVYEIQTWTLTVESTPITGVGITGGKAGTTNYTATCNDQDSVTLIAPLMCTDVDGVRYNFVKWTLDGVDALPGNELTVTMDADHGALAIYDVKIWPLDVQSLPIPGVAITGDLSGITNYVGIGTDQQVVALNAPAIHTAGGGVRYSFVRWILDDVNQQEGQTDLLLTLDALRTVVAQYVIKAWTISVTTSPVAGISIGGDRPGTSDYSLTCNDQKSVQLTAPETAVVSGKHYNFVRWDVGGIAQPDGQTSVSITATSDLAVEAVYAIQTWSLGVESSGVGGVAITGGKPGTTDYTETCNDQDSVTLTAPAVHTADGGVHYNFIRWTLDGDDQPAGNDLTVTVDADHTAVAVYEIQTWTLTVQSLPVEGVSIAGNKPGTSGTTAYSATINDRTVVTLTAPAVHTSADSVRYNFVKWSLDGTDRPLGQAAVSVTMAASHTVVATYQIQTWSLSVQSLPVTGIDITGTKPGRTNYAAICDDRQEISLTAPGTITIQGVDYAFAAWMVDGSARSPWQPVCQVQMNTNHTLQAVYRIPPARITDLTAELVPATHEAVAASSSGEYSAAYAAPKAIDSDPGTYWSTPVRNTPQDEYLTIDLGDVRPVDGVRMLPSRYPQLFPSLFTIDVSSDGTSWKTVVSEGAYQPRSGVWYTAAFECVDARYVRLSAASVFFEPGKYYVQVAEFAASVQQVLLAWTSTGGVLYDLRCTQAGPIVDQQQWDAALQLSGEPLPAAAGTAQSTSIPLDQLPAEDLLYFGLRVIDAEDMISFLSNSPSVDMPDRSPAAVTDLAVIHSTADSLTAAFTGTGDDGMMGTAAAGYDVRWSAAEITPSTWDQAQPVADVPLPGEPGAGETIVIPGLQQDTPYCVAVKVLDDLGHESELSNVAWGKTLDQTPPATIQDLDARLVNLGSPGKHDVIAVSSSGEYSAVFAAVMAVDDLPGTRWSTPQRSEPQLEHLTLDLGGLETVEKVRLLPGSAYPHLFPSDFAVELSADGSAWVQAAAVSGYPAARGVWCETSFIARTARYVRIAGQSMPNQPGAYYVQIAEAEVIGPSSRLPITGVESSGEWGTDFAALRAVDGARSTYWNTPARAASQPEYLDLDLGSVQTIEKVRLLPSSDYPSLFPSTFSIDMSTDGTTWTTAATETSYSAGSAVWYEKNIGKREARYVRLSNAFSVYYPPQNVYYMQVAEFHVYRPPVPGVLLSWTSPGDNGAAGTAESFDARWNTPGAIDGSHWPQAHALAGEPAPLPAGTRQSMLLSLDPLPQGVRVHFAMIAADEAGNASGVSNSPFIDIPGGLIGDTNRDCVVNIFDLIFIRSRLSQDVSTGDNWRADVNNDGNINVLDLITARNNLNRKCGQAGVQ